MKHYFVTGGAGFIGSAIVKMLLSNNNKVTVFDNFSRDHVYINENENLSIYNGDIRNKEDIEKSFTNIDAIFHLAFINGTKNFYNNPKEVLEVGIKGMLNIVDIAAENKVRELYLASSSEVYQTPNLIPTKEEEIMKIPDPYNPRYSYGAGKIISEIISINYGKLFLDKLIIFRPHNVYGPNMGYDHIIPEITKKILKNSSDSINIQGDGSQTRSFIYIDDFAEAIKSLIDTPKEMGTYNIGTNDEIKIFDLISLMMQILKVQKEIEFGKLPFGSTTRRCPDISKITNLGFKPKYDINSGLIKTLDWYKNNLK